MGKVVILAAVILFISLGIFGYTVYRKSAVSTVPVNSKSVAIPSSGKSIQPNDNKNQSSPSAQFSSNYLDSLTADERKVILMQRDSEILKQNQDLLNKVARTADFWDIGKCEPSPVIFKVNENAEFKIRNNDSADHTITVGSIKDTIPANSTKTYKADLGHSFGVYGASCDNSASGYILVSQVK